jgi:hypothetical protein
MAGLFGSAAFDDAVVGRLKRSGGVWRGTVELGGRPDVPLRLFGSGREPDAGALEAARELLRSFAGWRPEIEAALFDHYLPYGEAASADADAGAPAIARAEQVWPLVTLQSAAVTKISGTVTTELVYSAAWDEDHMLGVRFQAGRFAELCGSV